MTHNSSKRLRVLVACEYSGRVRDAFRALGHDAVSCDIVPTDVPGPHVQGDVLPLLTQGWDLLIAFPPCTYLCASGLHWNKRRPGRALKTEQALRFVQALLEAPIPRIALENPVGCISTRLRKSDQRIQPYEFGHDASKLTCLWLQGLPPLQPTKYVAGRKVGNRMRWSNQFDDGQNNTAGRGTPVGSKRRSLTYQGIADAMAQQWGGQVMHRPDPTPWHRFASGWQRTLRSPLVDAEVQPLPAGGWRWTCTATTTGTTLARGTADSPAQAQAQATSALLRLQQQGTAP